MVDKITTTITSGVPGVGVPVGGTTGQLLRKVSDDSYDTEWVSVAGGVDQNLFETIVADAGFLQASSPTNTLTISGGTNVTTTLVGNTLTIDAVGGSGDVESVNGQTGIVSLDTDDITEGVNKYTNASDISKLAGIENGANVNVQVDWNAIAGDSHILNKPTNLSEFTNDAGFITSVPVNSVNGQTGAVVLDSDDIDDASSTNKFTTASDISKLAGIEVNATADQTDAEIKTAYENNANTNAFTDANVSKLASIETGAKDDQNIFSTIAADVGSTSANTTSDTFSITGGTNVSTTIVGDTMVINATVGGAALPVSDSTSLVEGSVDSTKEMRIDVETNVGTGQTRTLIMPDNNVDLGNDFATSAQGSLASTAIQPNDNVSDLTNDAGYITSLEAPVQSVNGNVGAVVVDVIDDTTPQLGGDLDVNTNSIVATGANDITLAPDTGDINLNIDVSSSIVHDFGGFGGIDIKIASGSPSIAANGTNALNITDSSDAIVASFVKNGTAVNYLEVINAPFNQDVVLNSTGSDTDVDLRLSTKGNGKVIVDLLELNRIVVDGSINVVNKSGGTIAQFFDESSNASTNYITLINAATGSNPYISPALSIDTDVDLGLQAKGNGKVKIHGTPGYENNVTDDNDIPNKKYVDDAISVAVPTRYTEAFDASTDWGTASGGFYSITILAATHGMGTKPLVQISESVTGGFDVSNPDTIFINASGDVTFSVVETPDNRFAGEVTIL